MLRPEVIGVVEPFGAGEAKKARMLARAIIVQRGWRTRTGPRQRGCGRLRNRPVRAAAQRRSVKTGFRQHPLDGGNVSRLAAMGGASERQFLVGEDVTVGGACFHQSHRLQRLDR